MYIQNIELSELLKLNSGEVFSSSNWLSIYSNTDLKFLGVFNKNHEAIGFFYYQKHKRAKVLSHISPPFLSPTCGLYIKDESTNPAKKISFEKKVHELILEHVKSEKFDILTLPFPEDFMDMQPYIWAGFQVTPKFTYHINLLESEDKLLALMSPERRKNVTKSIKEGLVVKESLGCLSSQALIEKTFQDQGLWYDKQVLINLFSVFSDSNKALSYSTYHQNQLVATVFCVRDKEKAYYILGGFDKNNSFSGAGALAMWHAIKKAKEFGLKIFDFEGSMHPPIEKYFRGFGGEMAPYFCLEQTNWKGKLLINLRGK
jgi:hypothetical protein